MVPNDSSSPRTHSLLVYKTFERLQCILHDDDVKIDGESLDIASVVAVCRHDVRPRLDDKPEFISRIEDSVATLNRLLKEGKTVYGVNTGFGGSADTRTNHNEALQSALLQHHQFGVLTQMDKGLTPATNDTSSSHAMPPAWVKGTMLVRCNSITRGHSAVSLHVIEAIVALLRNNLTPIIPLRGSISASGDLSPLSYVAGTVTGNPDIFVKSSSGVISAKEALQRVKIDPIVLGPKEGLGLMNGTATSAAVGSLALYETHQIAVLSQLLTAMALEALVGSAGNYDSFIAKVRPHRGQMESAKNIRLFLSDSRLARGLDHQEDTRQRGGLLYQDRYALRTASQWIGPQLEDLLLAHEQVTTELNSTTDNPLIDIVGGTTHHGGNFQAVSITSAMEKARLSLQMIGKMLFAQSSELINPMLSNGLPPNLAADEPSLSYTMKGVDIGMASYMSELAFLANPVSSHVQSAEMHNQAINSLAFISARYTLQAVELTTLMSASYLYTVCQALDLRVLTINYFQSVEPALYSLHCKVFGKLPTPIDVDELHGKLWEHIQVIWLSTANKDSQDRCSHIVESALAVLADFFLNCSKQVLTGALSAIASWRSLALPVLVNTFITTRSHFFQEQSTPEFLGRATRRMYVFVRETLGVPFHTGLQDHPTSKDMYAGDGTKKQTIGSWIGIIYESIRSGQLHEPLMECLVETVAGSTANGVEEVATNGHSGDANNGYLNGTRGHKRRHSLDLVDSAAIKKHRLITDFTGGAAA